MPTFSAHDAHHARAIPLRSGRSARRGRERRRAKPRGREPLRARLARRHARPAVRRLSSQGDLQARRAADRLATRRRRSSRPTPTGASGRFRPTGCSSRLVPKAKALGIAAGTLAELRAHRPARRVRRVRGEREDGALRRGELARLRPPRRAARAAPRAASARTRSAWAPRHRPIPS